MNKSRRLYKKHRHREHYPDDSVIYADDIMVTRIDLRQAQTDIRRKLNVVKRRNGIPQSMGILFHVLVDGSVKVEPCAKNRYTFFRVKNDRMAELVKRVERMIVYGKEAQP